VIGLCLIPLGIAATYAVALGTAVNVSGIFYFVTQKDK
jgi:hypothetical protein